jgi:hypothetical protein|tara:strand:- start:141 stop:806 length:666 start_codon:yes stop_codon:yes gene_type:complete
MVRDARLDLGRYITNPFNRRGEVTKRLDFDDLFTTESSSGEYPFNPSRFEAKDLTKRAMTRKLNENPGLNFTPNTPFFDDNQQITSDYQLFEGLGRFNRAMDYDFDEGRAKTYQRPQDQPDYNPDWMKAYGISPTVNPGSASKNPMPRLKNPDPNGYIMGQAEGRAKNEAEGNMSVAQLLADQKSLPASKEKEEEKKEEIQGEKTEEMEQEVPKQESPEVK